jgi:hypothetical protein
MMQNITFFTVSRYRCGAYGAGFLHACYNMLSFTAYRRFATHCMPTLLINYAVQIYGPNNTSLQSRHLSFVRQVDRNTMLQVEKKLLLTE